MASGHCALRRTSSKGGKYSLEGVKVGGRKVNKVWVQQCMTFVGQLLSLQQRAMEHACEDKGQDAMANQG